ncbi:hypothetical protein [Streptomyces sp. NPDC093060]|uniref:hypothetical protein n=1 Tax=Streptomyces sp. NPDC093060 TaxID=3366019 RepID=UPI0037F31C8F
MIIVPNFLLVRSEDHVILGVSWSNLTISDTRPDGIPVLKATTDDARILLTFPPQHVAEETSTGGGTSPATRRAVLSGPSRLAVRLPPGTVFVPTVEGVLQALRQGRPIPPAAPPEATDTALELPWRMIFSVEDRRGGHDVTSVHPTRPMTVEGVTSLWQARLVTGPQRGDTPQDTSVMLRAIDGRTAEQADPDFPIPLGRAERARIAGKAGLQPAQATRLELSALGGTLAATGLWDTFQWEHQATLGRDNRVVTTVAGVLFPLGHRATYTETTERVFDQSTGNTAVLRRDPVLTVTEPIRHPPSDGPTARAFPFDDIEITTVVYSPIAAADWQDFGERPGIYFRPTRQGGDPRDDSVAFPVRCATANGDVRFEMPLLFVADVSEAGFNSLTDQALARHLSDHVYPQRPISLPGVQIDLVRAPARADGDVHEVHSITVGGSLDSSGYRPRLTALQVRLPALRTLLNSDELHEVHFSSDYLSQGPGQDIVLNVAPRIDIDFVGHSERSGSLVTPHFNATALSRTTGPVDLGALPAPATGIIDPALLFLDDATMLGFPLKDLITDLRASPKITSVPQPGQPPTVTMEWKGVKLRGKDTFQPTARSTLDLTVTASASGSDTRCSVNDFSLMLPSAAKPVIRLDFPALTFTQHSGSPPTVLLGPVRMKFLGPLQLLEQLGDAFDLGGLEPDIDVASDGLTAHYSLPLPPVTAGAFVMRDVVVNTAVTIPFNGQAVSATFGFASRQNPFTLAVLMFGGGGYLEVELDTTGMRRLEAGVEFGAMLAIDFLVARGEVHALGCVRFELTDGEVTVTGYLRIGGCVEVLGLLSVSIEMVIGLSYQTDTKALVGRATLVVEIDLTLWSDSVELDSGPWVLAGGRDPGAQPLASNRALDSGEGLERWHEYQAAFVPIETGEET